MNYYIYKNSIESMDRDLSLTNADDISTDFNDLIKNKFIQLNEDQIAFYLANPLLTVREIYLCRPDIIIEPTLEELKECKHKEIEDGYTNMSSSNFDVVLPSPVWDGYKWGLPKCTETVMWLLQMATERSNKINTVMNATNKSEFELISSIPSIPTKPHLADDMLLEVLTYMYTNQIP